MSTTICTLFEGDYHFGLAALVNSLYTHGYQGTIRAGYRGELPPWAGAAKPCEDMYVLAIAPEVEIYFLPVETPRHLTNYKPEFLLSVFDRVEARVETLFYFDPDLCLVAPAGYLEEWAACGVALCEDVNSPISLNHPRRVGWRRYFANNDFMLRPRETLYVNGGCIGLRRDHISFLQTWEELQTAMASVIGGLDASKLDGGTSAQMRDPYFCFNASDQDALNATIEAREDIPVSILGAEAMGFRPGTRVLPHALGNPKPWNKNYLREALRGFFPTVADKAFWRYSRGLIRAFSSSRLRQKQIELNLAAAIGRIIRRS